MVVSSMKRRQGLVNLWATLLLAVVRSSTALFPAERIRSSTKARHGIRPKVSSSSSTTTFLAAKKKFPTAFDQNDNEERMFELEPQRITERPTFTLEERPPINVLEPPSRKKIVVLGASGKIGRLVVRHLLDSPIDATIVAYCRNYDKACRVLFDDMIAVTATATTRKDAGPSLQIVQGELVQPGHTMSDDDISRFLSTFYNQTSSHESIDSNHLYSLAHAMHGASVVISCVGSMRPTNLWKDLVERPLWRLLRPKVESWCKDSRHPYYVHYLTTKVALKLAEGEEQQRRQRLEQEKDKADNTKRRDKASNLELDKSGGYVSRKSEQPHRQQRLRFIRVSDLSVGQPPWNIVPLFTNILQSMVLRYQEMAEAILRETPWIETIVLRPGDLVSWNYADQADYDEDEMGERDANTTAIQVGMYGRVPEPSRIGRDDVAALVVAAALFDDTKAGIPGESDKLTKRKQKDSQITTVDDSPPFHYTLACRWVGEQMHPYPPQGRMSDGHVDARVAMDTALTALSEKINRRREYNERMQNSSETSGVSRKWSWIKRKGRQQQAIRLKPYGLCVAIPTYFLLSMLVIRLIQSSPLVWGQVPLLQPLAHWKGGQQWLRKSASLLAATTRAVFSLLWRKSASSTQYIPV